PAGASTAPALGGTIGIFGMSGQGSAEFREALDAFQRGELERARAVAEREIASGASPQLHHLLGLIRCRQGDPAAGVEHLRAAAEAEPANAPFKVMLMRALIDAGRAEEVLAMPEPPAIRSAAELALWQARAEAADLATRPEASVDAWKRVAAATPSDWRAWSNLGNALAAQGQWADACIALEEAAKLNPPEAGIQANLVAALLQRGREHQKLLRFNDAEAAFRRAHELDPASPAVVHHLGIALERTNRLDALAKLLDEAVAVGISGERLNYLRAVLARREGRLEEARDLLLAADPQEEPVRWQALRAKIADALGETAEAFEAATAMNQAAIAATVGSGSREDWTQETRSYRADLHELAQKITPEWAARVPRLNEPVARRLSFLLGFPRSGTTLLDTFLVGHPEIEVLEEKQLVGRAADVVGGSTHVADASAGRLRQARQTYLDALMEEVQPGFEGLVVDKFPLDMAAAPVIEAVFPRAPIIFAQRHPCDVVLSGFMQPIGVVNFSNIEAAADYYHAMMSIWTASRDAMDLNVHTVVYEELVRDPEAVLRPLLDFLGLEWDERVLDHRRSAKERGTIVTPTYDQVTEPLSTRPSGRWTRYRKQLEPVLPTLLPWAERLGYAD
ncbi:MAG TPA: sulfotransferase, partial [Sphingomicrobium sp.]|nr:sulfotransferase [Sphingomicrobium sp.]